MASTYGWTHQEILDLTARQFFLYLRQIGKLSSIEQMKRFEASLLPHMKESNRKEVLDNYRQVTILVKVDKKIIEDAWCFLRNKRGKL